MRVAILHIYAFPYGMAATNRIAAYAQGLVENNVETDVISVIPPESPCTDNVLPNSGEYNGIHYIHPSGRYRSRNKIFRAFSMKSGWRFWSGVFRVYKILKMNHYDAVILSFDEPHQLYVYSHIVHYLGSKSIFIFDEYPIPIRHKLKTNIPTWKEKAYSIALRKIDGYISISEELKTYYNIYCTKPSIILPVIVNTSRFIPPIKLNKKEWITYIGNMELSKDNLDNIIKAFSLISNKFPNYSLHFFGKTSSINLKILSDLVNKEGLNGKVFFGGVVENSQVSSLIYQSKIMVSSQPNTLRAKGGFPTKLGEYVVTGTPTLLCDVGENSKYLTSEDCYYVEPENPKAYAEKLEYILSHYDEALLKAKHGRETVFDKYSHVAAGEKIKKFIKSI